MPRRRRRGKSNSPPRSQCVLALTPLTIDENFYSGISYYEEDIGECERQEIKLTVKQSFNIIALNPDEYGEVLMPETGFDSEDYVFITIHCFYQTKAKGDDYSEHWILDTAGNRWCPYHCVIRT